MPFNRNISHNKHNSISSFISSSIRERSKNRLRGRYLNRFIACQDKLLNSFFGRFYN